MSIQNLIGLLRHAGEYSSGRGVTVYSPTIKNGFSSISYQTLLLLARERSIQLQMQENLDNKVVLMHFTEHLDGIVWFWAIVASGGIPCICPPLARDLDQRRKNVKHLQDLLKKPLVITTQFLAPEFPSFEGLRVVATEDIELAQVELPTGWLPFQGCAKLEDDLAVLMLTSGSTGNPKAVCLKHGQILASIRGKSTHHRTTKDDVFLNWTGLDHVANLTEIHLHAISLAASQIHIRDAEALGNPMFFLEKIQSHKVTYTFAPNFFLTALIRSLEPLNRIHGLQGVHSDNSLSRLQEENDRSSLQVQEFTTSQADLDLSSLRALISGGESNVTDTCERLTTMLFEYGTPQSFIRPGFGMTETCAGSIYNAKDCPYYDIAQEAEFCSLGECINGIQMRIIRPNGTEAAVNEIGSLEVSGPIVFSGYYNDEKATQEAFAHDGWFKTGDLGLLDSNGRLRLTGRNKDIIVINGVNYSSQAIEAVIEEASIPGVAPSFTVAFPHRPKHSATETLCVTYLPAYANDDIQSRLSTTRAISKAVVKYCGTRPFKIIPLPESRLQKSSLGKLPRSKIRRVFEEGGYDKYEFEDKGPVEHNLVGSDIEATLTQMTILQVFHDVFGANTGHIGIDNDLFELGLSSIDLLKLKGYLQVALKIEVPVNIFFSHPVIRDLGQALDGLQKRKVYDPVTVLQPNGTKTPLFFIHPGVGEVLVFMNIARYFDDRPVYALRARGFDGEEYFSSMEEIVTVYHQAMKRVQPKGPYAIAGYSFGSILAFEIAKVMEANGDQVQFLATIDQPPHFKKRARTYDWYEVVLTISFFVGLIKEDHAYASLPEMREKTHEEVLDHILNLADPTRLAEVGLDRERLDNWARLAYQLKVIAWDYDPVGVVANMDVFYTGPLLGIVKARSMREWFEDYISKWKGFAKDLKFHEVEGTHRTLISPPHALGFQKLLKARMEERGL